MTRFAVGNSVTLCRLRHAAIRASIVLLDRARVFQPVHGRRPVAVSNRWCLLILGDIFASPDFTVTAVTGAGGAIRLLNTTVMERPKGGAAQLLRYITYGAIILIYKKVSRPLRLRHEIVQGLCGWVSRAGRQGC